MTADAKTSPPRPLPVIDPDLGSPHQHGHRSPDRIPCRDGEQWPTRPHPANTDTKEAAA
ncbi:hypothetical protein ABZ949_02555 [Micromonospora tulbaghiae]|uniref:hypothetical protein n=1 Tax=Micromonospora tulbaghiae TaxID=479978 RepID=UPI0033D6B69B